MSRISLMTATFAGAALFATGAFAQSPSPSTGTKLSQAECQAIWNSANPAGSASLSMTQAKPYVSDFSKVDSNSDGMLSESEFTNGCNQGLVKSSAATGAGSGASGSSSGSTAK